MRRFGAIASVAAICAALVASGPASARGGFGGFHGGGFGGGFHGGGFHGGGFRSAGFHGGGWNGGWHGGGWHGGGWRGAGWNGGGWRGGWNRGCWGCVAGAGLLGFGLGYGLGSDWGYDYPDYALGYGDPYGYGYGYNYGYPGYAYSTAAVAAPVTTGRSVATGGIGNYCATPVKTCELYHASYVGVGCSCKVSGGRARGTVAP
ncbi:MAG: hypothetical protein WDN46_19990 [Methylocella sp.]